MLSGDPTEYAVGVKSARVRIRIMNVEQAPHDAIKLFRRFARVLSGSQSVGDAVIDATLRTPFPEPSQRLDGTDLGLRTIIAQRLINVWAETSNHDPDGVRRTPPHHVAFLLRTLEGFSTIQVAEAIGMTPEETKYLIDRAAAEISNQLTANVLIVEDDSILAAELAMYVEKLGHHLIGSARTRDEAIHLTQTLKPQLIIADVELADGSSGIDVVRHINEQQLTPVIFITGHSEQVLTGAPGEPTFLLSKPYNPEELAALISQALFFAEDSQSAFQCN